MLMQTASRWGAVRQGLAVCREQQLAKLSDIQSRQAFWAKLAAMQPSSGMFLASATERPLMTLLDLSVQSCAVLNGGKLQHFLL